MLISLFYCNASDYTVGSGCGIPALNTPLYQRVFLCTFPGQGSYPCVCPGACSADIILFIFISKQMLDFEQDCTTSPGVQFWGDKDECWSLLVVVGELGVPGQWHSSESRVEPADLWHCSQAPSSSAWALNWSLPRTIGNAVRNVEASPPACVYLLSFWLSESALSCPELAWKCSLSLCQVPLLCSSVTFSLHHSPAQPKVLLPKLFCFTLLWSHQTCYFLYVPRGVCISFIGSLCFL